MSKKDPIASFVVFVSCVAAVVAATLTFLIQGVGR